MSGKKNIDKNFRPDGQEAILVTGSAGFIGQEVARHLARDKRAVVALYHRRLPETQDQVFPVCSDMSSPELLAAPLRNISTAIHLAWDGGLVGPEDQNLQRFTNPQKYFVPGGQRTKNLQYVENLLAAMERAGTQRLIFVSAVGASPNSESLFLREKYFAEFLILNSKIPEKIIIRSGVVWDSRNASDKFLRSIANIMRLPVYPLPPNKQAIAPVHIGDLAQVIVTACQYKSSEPALMVTVQGAEQLKVDEVCKIVSETYLRKPRLGIGGIIGRTLYPLFDRESRNATIETKLKYFLDLSYEEPTEVDSASTALLPAKTQSLRQQLQESMAGP